MALLLLLGIGGAAAYLMSNSKFQPGAGASLSLPGDLGNTQASSAAKSNSSLVSETELQSMQAMAADNNAASAKQSRAPAPVIEADLSPTELLAKYPPPPGLTLLDDDSGDKFGDGARRYRRPNAAPAEAKRLALVVTGLGLDRVQTAQTILATPPDVTLSFRVASTDLAGWIAAARAYGHEALIDLQLGTMAGGAGTASDAAGDSLLVELGPQENLRRLEAIFTRAPKTAGVAVEISNAFLGDAAALTPILARLQAGGWIVVGLPVTAPMTIAADRVLDQDLTPDALARESMTLKALARQRGAVLALTTAGNAIVLSDAWSSTNSARNSGQTDQVKADAATAELSLVPASALVED